MKILSPSCVLYAFALCIIAATAAHSQTYTAAEFVAGAPLAWQVQHDPAGRLTVGNDDGNVFAAPHSSAWASAWRAGGAQGLEGLLYDQTLDPAGAPYAFGLARRGCVVTDEASLINCVRVRWEARYFLDGITLVAVVTDKNGTVFGLAPQVNVQPGDSFSIERLGNSAVNFYRSTGVAGERQRVATVDFPFVDDGFDPATPIEARAVFAPGSVARKVSGWENYYCCL